MQIVIDIPDDLYNYWCDSFPDGEDAEEMRHYIKNGKILPKHGRLIDADDKRLVRKLWFFNRYTGIDEAPYEPAVVALDNAPTVLEATEAQE